MALDAAAARERLKRGDLDGLFIEELGWSRQAFHRVVRVAGQDFQLTAIAASCGFVAFEVGPDDGGRIPVFQVRSAIQSQVRTFVREHLVVFVNRTRSEMLWQPPPGPPGTMMGHRTFVGEVGEGLMQILRMLCFWGLDSTRLSLSFTSARVQEAFKSDRYDYYADYFKRLAQAEEEAGVTSFRPRKSLWNYEDNIADYEFTEEDYGHIAAVAGARIARSLKPPLPLDTVYSPVNRDRRLAPQQLLRADLLQSPESLPPPDAVVMKFLAEDVDAVLDSLGSRERRVLKLRFGLHDGRARTLEEVGREFGVTRERIRQIEAKALRKLREPSRSKRLRAYIEPQAEEPIGLPAAAWRQREKWRHAAIWTSALSRIEALLAADERGMPGADSASLEDEGARAETFAEACARRKALREEVELRRMMAYHRGALAWAWFRTPTGAIKLMDVPGTALSEFTPAVVRLRGVPAPQGPPGPDIRTLSGRSVTDSQPPTRLPPYSADAQVLGIRPVVPVSGSALPAVSEPACEPREERGRQQPLQLPGALPLFDAPTTSKRDPEQLEGETGGNLGEPLSPLENVPPASPVSEREQNIQLAVAAFQRDGYQVNDLRAKGGCLWVYDPGMNLAHKVEGLRTIGIRFIYAEHTSAAKWGWWLK